MPKSGDLHKRRVFHPAVNRKEDNELEQQIRAVGYPQPFF